MGHGASSMAAGLMMVLAATAAPAQTPGGQTGGTSGGTGSASANGGQGDAGGTGQIGVKTTGTVRPINGAPSAGSSAGDVSRSPVVGAGAGGNGGVMSGTTGTDPTPPKAP